MRTITEMVTVVAGQNPRRSAIVEGETTITYAELNDRIHSLSIRLYELGIRQGDRAAILLPNGSHFVTSYFAVASLGAIIVPLNDQYQQTELLRFFTETGASLIITCRRFSGLCQQVMRSYGRPCQLLLVEDSAQATTPGSQINGTTAIDADAPVMYQFSSGSTGRPKRISRTHRNLLFELDSLIQTLGISAEDRFLGVTPFSHVNGLMRSMMASLRAGATLYPVAQFDRHGVVEMIEKHRISIFIGVPFMFGVMAKTNYDRRPDFSSLRLCISASAPMPAKLNHQFKTDLECTSGNFMGRAETGTICADLNANIERSLGVGRETHRQASNVEIYCRKWTSGALNEIGEIAVKSPAAIQSYGSEDLDNDVHSTTAIFLREILVVETKTACSIWLDARSSSSTREDIRSTPERSRSCSRAIPKSTRLLLLVWLRLSVIKR